jgi:hypothetical protein
MAGSNARTKPNPPNGTPFKPKRSSQPSLLLLKCRVARRYKLFADYGGSAGNEPSLSRGFGL